MGRPEDLLADELGDDELLGRLGELVGRVEGRAGRQRGAPRVVERVEVLALSGRDGDEDGVGPGGVEGLHHREHALARELVDLVEGDDVGPARGLLDEAADDAVALVDDVAAGVHALEGGVRVDDPADGVDVGQGGAGRVDHRAVHAAARVVQPGGVHQDGLEGVRGVDPHDAGACGLRLVRDGRDLHAEDAVEQRRLADVGAPDERDGAGAEVVLAGEGRVVGGVDGGGIGHPDPANAAGLHRTGRARARAGRTTPRAAAAGA